MPEDFTKLIIKQLVTSLKALHERGILHRDIKEANVMMGEKGRGKFEI